MGFIAKAALYVILVIILMTYLAGSMVLGQDLFSSANPFGVLLTPFKILALFAAVVWLLRFRETRRAGRSAALQRLPNVLDDLAANLARAESGISNSGNAPAVVSLGCIKEANRLCATASYLIKTGKDSAHVAAARKFVPSIFVDEEGVRKFLRSKNSVNDVEGIERFTESSREALAQLRLSII